MSCIYCGTSGVHAPGCPNAGNRIVEIHPRGEYVEMSNRDEDEYDFYPQSGEQVITLRLREWKDFSYSDDADLEGGRKPSRRSLRYGKLVRGWDWRTTPELLEKAETKRKELNLSRTEFLEKAINKLIEND